MDPMTMLSLGTSLFGGLGSLFGGNKESKNYEEMARQIQAAMEEQRKLTGQANNLISPWHQAGQNEIGGYQQNYKKLMDPEFINKLMGDYKTSNWANQQLKSGNQAITNAASASGSLNSGQFGKDMANYSTDIMSRDQNQYIDRILQQYGIGVGHQGDMVGNGMRAGGLMGQNLIGMGDRNINAIMAAQKARMEGSQAQQGGQAGLMNFITGGLSGLRGLSGLGGLGGLLKR